MGHKAIRDAVAPVKVATGEMCQNRILFKQIIAAGAVDIVLIDACRLGGLNEGLAVQFMAAKAGLPVWPHAGGVGLCEYVQHLSMIDYLPVSGTMENRVTEFVDHLHEHFTDPRIVVNGAYRVPEAPGFPIRIRPETLARECRDSPVGRYGCFWGPLAATDRPRSPPAGLNACSRA